MISGINGHIAQQMQQRGHDKFVCHPVSVILKTNGAAQSYSIPGYSAFYFLAERELPEGTIIESDNNAIEAIHDIYFDAFPETAPFEGNVKISVPPLDEDFQINFIQVTVRK